MNSVMQWIKYIKSKRTILNAHLLTIGVTVYDSIHTQENIVIYLFFSWFGGDFVTEFSTSLSLRHTSSKGLKFTSNTFFFLDLS